MNITLAEDGIKPITPIPLPKKWYKKIKKRIKLITKLTDITKGK